MNARIKQRVGLVMLLLMASGSASAVNVRGRIDFGGPAGTFPMANATVMVCSAPNACVTYVTGNDGMFYVQLNPGQYSVTVNGVQKVSVTIPDQPNYDAPAILGN